MTVQELYNELGKEIKAGHGDLRVIANCNIERAGENVWQQYFTELDDVYYQSGDIELGFSQSKEE